MIFLKYYQPTIIRVQRNIAEFARLYIAIKQSFVHVFGTRKLERRALRLVLWYARLRFVRKIGDRVT